MEAQGILTVVSTVSERLGQLPVKYGQLIFVKDSRELYLDHQEGRILYNQIIILETEAQRLSMKQPVSSFYFIKETGVIWRYDDNTWILITNPPSEQIEFLPKHLFPLVGKVNTLYIDDVKIYRWLTNEYVEMGVPIWETFS